MELPEHTPPHSLGERPTLENPPEPISPIESVHLLQYVCGISDFCTERTAANHHIKAPSLYMKYHLKDVPYQATHTLIRTHPTPSANHPPDPIYPPVLLTKLLDFGLTGVVYLSKLGNTAIAAKQALQEGMGDIMHEADIYLLLNNTRISGRGIPIYFGTFACDDMTFMLTSYCGNSFGTWKQMWLLQLYVDSSLAKMLLNLLSSLHTRHILIQLHHLGVCHSDIHPGNIVRDWCGRVSIVDFASATTLHDCECKCYQQLDKAIHSRLRKRIPYLFITLVLFLSLLSFY